MWLYGFEAGEGDEVLVLSIKCIRKWQ